MKSTLARALRPKSLSQLFGHQDVIAAIKSQMRSKREPCAWMFAGPPGVGKTTIAKILALSLQCTHAPFGAPCLACRKNKADFAITNLPAAKLNGVEPIKEVVTTAEYSPMPPSRRRVIILDEAQRITKQAQSILLDPFEFPSPTTVWIICTTEPEQILPALRSRCMVYLLRGLDSKNVDLFVAWAVKKGNIERPVADFVEVLHKSNITSPRLILYGLERFAAGLDPEKAITEAETDIDTRRICQAFIRGEWNPIRSELAKSTPEDGKVIRGALLGYLRAVLLSPKQTIERKKVGAAIEAISSISQYVDDTTMSALLPAILHREVKRFE